VSLELPIGALSLNSERISISIEVSKTQKFKSVVMLTYSMRPTGVTILAVLYAIGGILGLAGGAVKLDAVTIVLGIVDLAIAYGLWNGQNWSRILVVIFSILGIIGSAVMIVLGPTLMMFMFKANPMMASKMGMFMSTISTVFTISGIIGIVTNAIILYYLTRPHVRNFFTA